MAFDWATEWISYVPLVSAASYLFITGTRLGLTGFSSTPLIWHTKKVIQEEDTYCASFISTCSPHLSWMSARLPMAHLSGYKQNVQNDRTIPTAAILIQPLFFI